MPAQTCMDVPPLPAFGGSSPGWPPLEGIIPRICMVGLALPAPAATAPISASVSGIGLGVARATPFSPPRTMPAASERNATIEAKTVMVVPLAVAVVRRVEHVLLDRPFYHRGVSASCSGRR